VVGSFCREHNPPVESPRYTSRTHLSPSPLVYPPLSALAATSKHPDRNGGNRGGKHDPRPAAPLRADSHSVPVIRMMVQDSSVASRIRKVSPCPSSSRDFVSNLLLQATTTTPAKWRCSLSLLLWVQRGVLAHGPKTLLRTCVITHSLPPRIVAASSFRHSYRPAASIAPQTLLVCSLSPHLVHRQSRIRNEDSLSLI